jgi:hypothetical protein
VIARIHWEGIERRAGAWLAVQPLLSVFAFQFEHGPLLIELGLALLALMVAFGGESERTRERMEYLAHLPRSLRHTELVALATSCGTLLAVAAFHWLAEITGVLDLAVQAMLASESDRTPVVWQPHVFRWPWLNLLGVPLGLHAITVFLLRRRRSVQASKRPGLGQTLVLVIGLTLLTVAGAVVPLLGEPEVEVLSHAQLERNLPGALGLIVALVLQWRLSLRAVTLGIDGFPEEETTWDS